MEMPSYISTGLHYQHKSLIDLIDNLSDDQIRRQVITGKWSIFENIVHLQTYQHIFIKRVKQIREEKTPVFDRYSAEGDANFLENCGLTSREVLQDLISTRKDMAKEMPAIPSEDLAKEGIHPVYGKMNLLHWMNFFLLHEAHHLFTILKLSGELRKA